MTAHKAVSQTTITFSTSGTPSIQKYSDYIYTNDIMESAIEGIAHNIESHYIFVNASMFSSKYNSSTSSYFNDFIQDVAEIIAHEIGHGFNLYHPSNNNSSGICGISCMHGKGQDEEEYFNVYYDDKNIMGYCPMCNDYRKKTIPPNTIEPDLILSPDCQYNTFKFRGFQWQMMHTHLNKFTDLNLNADPTKETNLLNFYP
jgi:hypothetical protein